VFGFCSLEENKSHVEISFSKMYNKTQTLQFLFLMLVLFTWKNDEVLQYINDADYIWIMSCICNCWN